MFASDPKARADLRHGTLYAVTGEGGWIYYGQIVQDTSVGFFRRRDRVVADAESILVSPVMAVIDVAYPSIGRALRSGSWRRIGRYDLPQSLQDPRPKVQWPVGTLDVIVWEGPEGRRETRVEDPTIQDLELMAVWEADEHIPARLTADFGTEKPRWDVGGLIWRERRVKEEMARRWPDQPWHRLPPDWVPTDVR